ncbi:MAG: sulfatase-like hydrolase/transferase [Planctomycetota bacterium]|jgi:arylsulfatase A-like enzyme/Tfp pilus assembly protein PilF
MAIRKVTMGLMIITGVISLAAVMAYRHFSRPSIRHVVLISMDTTRADYLSCYGYPHKTTPNIDAVAAEAVRFEHVISPVPLTLPSHSTMMTGTIPPRHGVHDNLNYTLGDSNVTLAEVLKLNGYTTGAVISSYVLESRFGLDQGFDDYDDEFDQTLTDVAGDQRRGGEVSEHAVRWLQEHQTENFFLFLHYYDPHSPYNPPDNFKNVFASKQSNADSTEKAKLAYAEEIAYTDHCIGQVIDKLKSLGLYDSTLLFITGDHGEGLGEHKEMGHGYFIYQESIKVPLIVKVPGSKKAQIVNDMAGLIDIPPTVCSLLGVESSESFKGQDLSGLLRHEPSEGHDRSIYSESLVPTKYQASPLLGLVSVRYKYIQSTRPELYDLRNDPGETNNMISQDPHRARLMEDALAARVAGSLAADTADSRTQLDEESVKKLESLGYVGGRVDEDYSFDQDKPDPKDMFRYHTDLVEIMLLMRNEDYEAAEKACQKIVSEGFEFSEVYSHLAKIASIKYKDDEQAIDYPNKAVALEPDSLQTLEQLGKLLLNNDQYPKALDCLLKAHEIQPRSATICHDIARAYYKLGQRDKAIEFAHKTLSVDPKRIESRSLLATALFETGEVHAAIEQYYIVLDDDKDNLQALNFLAWVQATSRDPEIRNPNRALKLAKRAAKAADYNSAEYMDTLAVAYAAAGDFDLAVQQADKAIRLARSAGDAAMAKRIAGRRELFRNRKVYSE